MNITSKYIMDTVIHENEFNKSFKTYINEYNGLNERHKLTLFPIIDNFNRTGHFNIEHFENEHMKLNYLLISICTNDDQITELMDILKILHDEEVAANDDGTGKIELRTKISYMKYDELLNLVKIKLLTDKLQAVTEKLQNVTDELDKLKMMPPMEHFPGGETFLKIQEEVLKTGIVK